MKTLKINKSICYQSEDGQVQLDLRVKDGSIWLNQLEIAELFQTTKQNISLHIRNILESGVLCRDVAVREFLVIQPEGRRQVRRHLTYYNLDLILATGNRLRSLQGVRFRQWADIHLREFLYRNFAPDEERYIHM
ncbi:RhuM family protein [Nitrosomonas sp.]|uniref:RhuM family protein n=1 Tax=Nitrosomonas sp. TaxID=42353 RepID=UPI0025FF5BBC|nr:RhuM family protein [Nitrosomonas sp.]MCC6917006.1 virulence RhuM family protein [Nitrosomonas sp.]